MLGVFPVGHDDNFQPFSTLIQAFAGDGHDEHATTTLVKAPALAAPVVAPVDPFSESTTTDEKDDDDSIAGLIDDMHAQNSGGGGEAQ
jgi:hypothetical protein